MPTDSLLDVILVSWVAKNNPVVLLLFNAGPLDITWAKLNPSVAAILVCFFSGQGTGKALYSTLTASDGPASVPAARLPSTWPSYLSQVFFRFGFFTFLFRG